MSQSEVEKIAALPFFFIIGRPRSGTTLLQLFFDAHPNVQIPSECMYIGQLWSHYSKISVWTKTDIENYIRDLKNTWLFTPEKFNIGQIEKELSENISDLNAPLVFKTVTKNFNSIYEKKGIMLLGDKNPFYSQTFGGIFITIPDAKFILLIRDPRDNHISLFNSRFTAPSITYDTLYWKKTIRTIEQYQKYFPDRFYIIRYEDLVTDTEKYLKEMCGFLGIPFEPEMLKYRERKTDDFTKVVFSNEAFFKANHTSILEPVSTSKIGGWKTRLSKSSIKKAERTAGIFLDKYGYERLRKTPGIWSLFSTIPGRLLYFIMEKGVSETGKRLPKKMQLIIVRNIHIPFKILWRLFTKKGQKL
jgi:hypothetical protein